MTRLTRSRPQPASPAGRDADRYKTAQAIQQAHPDWLVVWGVYTREYVAFPLFRAPAGAIIQSASPDRLLQRMQQAELAFTADPARQGTEPDPFDAERHQDADAERHQDADGWQGGDSPTP